METFKFLSEPAKTKEPTITIDLRPKIEEYKSKSKEEKIPCQEMEYLPDQRAKKK